MVVRDLLRIGAASDNDFHVSVAGVSRHHARITREGDAYWLEDAGSTNGTFLNGERVTRERLRHLDVITLGRDVDLISVTLAKAEPGELAAAPKAVEDAWLEPVQSWDAPGRIDIPAGELTLGRLAPSNVVLDSPVVSQLHARIRRTADHVIVQDLDSANGTFVNGRRITEATVLADGDALSIAGSRQFTVHIAGNLRKARQGQVVPTDAAAFDPEWQTRLVWSADELAELEAERRRILELVRKEPGLGNPAGAAAGVEPAAPPPPRPAAAAATLAAPPTPKVTTGAVPRPANLPPPPAASAATAPVETPAPVVRRVPTPAVVPPKLPEATPVMVGSSDEPTIRMSAPDSSLPPTVVMSTRVRTLKLSGPKGSFQLDYGRHAMGRSEGVAVPILDPQVSRAHAVIVFDAVEARVEDAGGANGTFVNGARVPAAGMVLKHGDRLSLGSVEFTVELIS